MACCEQIHALLEPQAVPVKRDLLYGWERLYLVSRYFTIPGRHPGDGCLTWPSLAVSPVPTIRLQQRVDLLLWLVEPNQQSHLPVLAQCHRSGENLCGNAHC